MEFVPAADSSPVTSSSLEDLRTRLATARLQRGLCPPLADIRGDHLPTIVPREGVDERGRHVERCAVCQHQLRSWLESWEGRTALALAWSHVASHHTRVRLRSWWSKLPKRATGPHPVPVEIEAGLAPAGPAIEAWTPPAPPREHRGWRPRAKIAEALPPLLVFEAPPPGVVPRALLAAMGERGGAVVTVESLDEVFGDRDFASVRALVLGRARPMGEWPQAIRRAREQAPGRAVLAVVPVPSFGRMSLGWLRDPAVLEAPVQDHDWEPALERAGWPATT